jgi:hypothetical protein
MPGSPISEVYYIMPYLSMERTPVPCGKWLRYAPKQSILIQEPKMSVKQAEKVEIGIDGEYDGDVCPECGKAHVPNAVTLAAMQEAGAIARGEIPGVIFIDPTQYRTREELKIGLKQALQS